MDVAELDRLRRRGLRLVLRHRRWLAAASTGLAVLCGLSALRPRTPPTVAVWAAARDLSGGAPLTAADLRVARLPVADVPAAALSADRSVTGQLLAAPVRRGEPLTDVRLLSTALLARLPTPDDVAVPVRVADGAATAAVVRPGDTVDVIVAADPSAGGATAPAAPRTVASALRVLAVPGAGPSSDGAGLLVVAASPAQAADLAAATSSGPLSIAVRQPP